MYQLNSLLFEGCIENTPAIVTLVVDGQPVEFISFTVVNGKQMAPLGVTLAAGPVHVLSQKGHGWKMGPVSSELQGKGVRVIGSLIASPLPENEGTLIAWAEVVEKKPQFSQE